MSKCDKCGKDVEKTQDVKGWALCIECWLAAGHSLAPDMPPPCIQPFWVQPWYEQPRPRFDEFRYEITCETLPNYVAQC